MPVPFFRTGEIPLYMRLNDTLRRKMEHASPLTVLLLSSISAFCIYVCTYGFRKSFAAATFEGQVFWGMDYKVLLVIAQVFGYATSKFIGIKVISEVRPEKRPWYIIGLLVFAWLCLLGLALLPAPWGILCMFANGLPLGMIWGLVYSYLEGRRATEIMATILSASLIFSAGLVKWIGRTMVVELHMPEQWMPFAVGAVFFLPMLLFVALLNVTPAPTPQDKAARSERTQMFAEDRKAFLRGFWPGFLFNLGLYITLTAMRDLRDNFEVEIWQGLYGHPVPPSMYAQIDTPVSIAVLLSVGALVYVRSNRQAFRLSHLLILLGFLSIGLGSYLFFVHAITPFVLMYLAAFGLYLAYIPYQVIFFERLIAVFRIKGNIGFLIYAADSIGYAGSVGVLLYKEFGKHALTWGSFFTWSLTIVALVGIVCIGLSYRYFERKMRREKSTQPYAPNSAAMLASA
jgi:MFS family permease